MSWGGAPTYRESLQDLPPDVAQALLTGGSRRQWRKGQVVLRQGAAVDTVVVCLQGQMSVMLSAPSGRDTLLRYLMVGEMVAMPAVLAGSPFPVTITAQGPCSTLHVGRDVFIEVLTRHPKAAIGIAILLSNRLAELFRFVEMTAQRPLAERVRYALSRLTRQQIEVAQSSGERKRSAAAGDRVTLRVTQAELAAAAGASRHRVHLALRALQTQGVLTLGYGCVHVNSARL